MIAFRPRTFMESVKRLWPPYRQRQDEKMRAALRYLIEHPEQPCMIEQQIIPHGFGQAGGVFNDLTGPLPKWPRA